MRRPNGSSLKLSAQLRNVNSIDEHKVLSRHDFNLRVLRKSQVFTMLPDKLENRKRLGRLSTCRKHNVTNEIVLELVPLRWVQGRFKEPSLANKSRGTLVYRVAALSDIT